MESKDTVPSLIRKAQEGDRSSFDCLVETYQPRLHALISRRTGPHIQEIVEISDILQDTLVRAFQSIDRFEWKGEESFMRWLGTIAENLILNASKKYARQKNLRLDRDVAASETSPSKALRREERFDRLESALKDLSEDYRTVILLSRIEGLSIKEIAPRMRRSESAVKNLLLRALKGLRSSFGDTESLRLPDRGIDMERDAHGE